VCVCVCVCVFLCTHTHTLYLGCSDVSPGGGIGHLEALARKYPDLLKRCIHVDRIRV